MKFGVVVFPGSNCDHDMEHVLGTVMAADVQMLWHKETSIGEFSQGDCIVLPGGFSYGDYLRAGAIARFSPIMQSVIRFAKEGGFVLGICNGFQILCEAHLLPGALVRNEKQKFISKTIYLKTCNTGTPLTNRIPENKIISMPIAHAEGRFITDDQTLQSLYDHDQILFKYCTPEGVADTAINWNGSTDNIAGICNAQRNVFGMMPHPERAAEKMLGGEDGRLLFESLMQSYVIKNQVANSAAV